MNRNLIDNPGNHPIGIVGAGLIGLGWIALFVHRGHWVRAHDPDPIALVRLNDEIDGAIAEIEAIDGPRRASGRLECSASLADALDGCAYVQENAPERLKLKGDLLSAMAAIAPVAVIGSSTSSFTATELGEGQVRPNQIVIAHPFNPPHLIPLVEIGGQDDDSAGPVVDFVCDLFTSLGRVPVRIRRPVRGHIANRLSAALFREAVQLVRDGIASVEDVDRAVQYGPGLRWATAGPFLNYHLGAGSGGLSAYLEHLGPAQEARWADLGSPTLDDETKALLVKEMGAAAGDNDIEYLTRQRANRLIEIQRALATTDEQPPK